MLQPISAFGAARQPSHEMREKEKLSSVRVFRLLVNGLAGSISVSPSLCFIMLFVIVVRMEATQSKTMAAASQIAVDLRRRVNFNPKFSNWSFQRSENRGKDRDEAPLRAERSSLCLSATCSGFLAPRPQQTQTIRTRSTIDIFSVPRVVAMPS